jgi:hypothetical protein
MDLDTLKAAWQQQEIEAPSSSLLIDEVREARWRLVIVAATVLRDSQSLMARAGMILTIASSIGYVVLPHVARIRNRPARMDSTLRTFCRQELEYVDSSIRQRRLRATWYTLPPAAGVILWFASLRPSVLEWIVGAAVAAGGFLYSWWMSERKIRKDLLPLREELSRQLRELESNGSQAA